MNEPMHPSNADHVSNVGGDSANETSIEPPHDGAGRWALAFALVVFAAGVVPFVALSMYAHPQNDDFLFAVIVFKYGWVHANLFWYMAWTGRFTSSAIMSMSPVAFGSIATYQWAAVCVIVVLWVSTWIAVSAASPVGTSRARRFLLSTTLLAVFLSGMPDLVQGLYFMTGAVTYQVGGALLLLVWAFTLRAREPCARPAGPPLIAAAAVATVLAAGTNEIVALLSVAVLGYGTLVARRDSGRLDRTLVVLLLLAIAAGSLALLSPGNRARAGAQERDLAGAVVGALQAGSGYAWFWLSRTPLVPIAALLLPSLAAASTRARRPMVHPALAAVAFVATYFACFVPPLYGGGLRVGDEVVMGALEPRTVNVIFGFFLAGSFAVLHAAASWYGRRSRFSWAPRVRVGFIAAAVALAVVPEVSHVRTAWTDLLSGTAAEYDSGLSARYRTIASCRVPICAVPPVVLPRSLSMGDSALDMSSDGPHMEQYKQDTYAAYFGKKRIVLAAPSP